MNFKLAILHSAFIESGGAERVVLNQLKYLRLHGFKVDCYGAIIDHEKCFSDELKDLDIHPYLTNISLPKFQYSISLPLTILLSNFISQKMKKKKYKVLLCHHQPSGWLGYKTWLNFKTPYICYVHHPPRFIYPRPVEAKLGWGHDLDRKILGFFGKHLRFVKEMDRLTISNAKVVLANSKKTLNEIKKIYKVDAVLCYPGVEIPNISPDQTSNKQRFLFVSSRHTPHKKLEWLLQIFKIILKDFDVPLVVAGAFHPTYTSKIKKTALKLGLNHKILFVNRIPNKMLNLYYKNAYVYLYPAPNEDFGLGPVEAMAHGVPVVVWDDNSGPAETVIDGVTGFKAKPYNLEDFAQKTLKILVDEKLRNQMAKNAIKHAQANFSMNKHINQLKELLYSISH